jgi:hypothetical protein
MSFTELTAALVERLHFYKCVLAKMEAAVKAGDTDRIEAYSQLETRTASEISALRECFIARSGESPRALDFVRTAGEALDNARAASERLRGILTEEKELVAAQLQGLRGKTPPGSSPPEPPSVIDYQA